ncbi:sodium/calcium exchanger NCL-like [Rutidosis leptorrhynchoides]|uniref:sodium/calcium exchanger NCL-like n=1 Tax=Rutidosis leptorrhynchoides TaxID=125765 RepID=UPI003A997A05
MTSVRFTLIVFTIIIGLQVKGRLIELKTYPTTSMISDGIHDDPDDTNLHLADDSKLFISATLYGDETRCESMYGFLPCANTMQEGVFLMIMYTYLMMLGEEWIHKGSEALFMLMGDKAFGASVFRVLMAMPRIVLVIVSAFMGTESAAQNQVAFGFGMYAGSTVITLTFIWGFRIILSRDTLRGKGSTKKDEHQQHDESTKCLSLTQKLSILNDTGVNIDKGTGDVASIMLLSLIPFATVELVGLTNTPGSILFALVLSGLFVLAYFAHQIGNPLLAARTMAYLRQENLQGRFIDHVQKLAEKKLIDEQGNPDHEAFKNIFIKYDNDKDMCISHTELEHLIDEVFGLNNKTISKEYAKAEILTHFDDDKSQKINVEEFEKGCTKWLQKWKNDASTSASIWKKVEIIAVRNKRAEITHIDKIMPRIMNQLVLTQQQLVKDGKPNREKIEGMFSNYDKDNNNEIQLEELSDFIRGIDFGVELDHNAVLDGIVKEFDHDGNLTIGKQEFIDGFVKWIEKAMNHDPSISEPQKAFDKFDKDSWREIDAPMPLEIPKAHILYVIFGVGIMYLISGAFMQSVIQFSNAAHIPFRFTSFVMAPLAMNTRMVITALLNVGVPHATKNASLTFSEMYNGLVMNNLLGLLTLLITVYVKQLSWIYSDEVLSIMIPCAMIGLFAFSRDTYPLWASISAMFLYPISIYIYYLMAP